MTPLTATEYQALAHATLQPATSDFIDGGSGDERALAENLRSFDDFRLLPRVLVDVAHCDTTSALLGAPIAGPVGIAPTAYHRLVHPDGEVATARAAGEAGALYVVSFFASQPIEEIAAAATGPLWLQLYWLRAREALAELAARAEAAGYQALVLTVDAPRIGQRLRDVRNGFALDPSVSAVNLDPTLTARSHRREEGSSALAEHALTAFDQRITWADLAWLRGVTGLPLLLKGILTAQDAELAIAHGAAGVIVSNHGGRQLEPVLAPIHALSAVVDAVAGRGVVLCDGGFRRGADIFTALALGADAVLLGRPVLWALAARGGAGVAHLIELLRADLAHVMALTGRPALPTIDRTAVRRWN